MGTIPRRLERITGFVECKFGPLPYEDEEDKEKLEVYAKIFDLAFARGAVYRPNRGELIQFRGEIITRVERKTTELIFAHALRNIGHPEVEKKLRSEEKNN